jgi:dipeptidyl aminopeptidase/acylaminoacyl peptidase
MSDNQLSPWAIERRIHYPSISDVALSPDGSSVLYVVAEPLLTGDKSEFVSQIYRAAPGGEPSQLTFGDHRNDAPRWSPDGRYIAFLSRRSGHANIRHSPVLQVRGVQTPTLILHGDQDVRVPLSQGRELYSALKRQSVPTELIIYPRQGHGLNEPRLIMDLSRRTTDWLVRYVLEQDATTT